MAKKPNKKKETTPKYDSKREQNVLLEEMHKDIKAIAEGHSGLNRKIDKVEAGLGEVKSELNEVKSELNSVGMAVKELDKKTDRIEQKLNIVTRDHEDRLNKLETVR